MELPHLHNLVCNCYQFNTMSRDKLVIHPCHVCYDTQPPHRSFFHFPNVDSVGALNHVMVVIEAVSKLFGALVLVGQHILSQWLVLSFVFSGIPCKRRLGRRE